MVNPGVDDHTETPNQGKISEKRKKTRTD